MRSSDSLEAREAAVRNFVASRRNVAILRNQLQEIVEGEAFRDRHRSSQFLSYIVEQAIEGNFESLKERLIGVELFGRAPSYDTGEDAIVRVTASDVRKRLLQHYGKYGSQAECRITLPSGSYIPEFCRIRRESSEPASELLQDAAEPPAETYAESPAGAAEVASPGSWFAWAVSRRWQIASVLLLVACSVLSAVAFNWKAPQSAAADATLPWSVFFHSQHPVQLITSDPNLIEIQDLTGNTLTVAEYANRQYIPAPSHLSPDTERICRALLHGDVSSPIDTQIAVNLGELAQRYAQSIHVHSARSLQPSELKTDDNYILVGSPRSNPWTALFSDQLDFQLAYDVQARTEYVRNLHPRAGEQTVYWPKPQGEQAGDSYAIVALVRNPDQNGLVLMLAGVDSEGTRAAGRLAVDTGRFASALQACTGTAQGSIHPFEMLLHLGALPGSSKHTEVMACHTLRGSA